MKKVVHIKELNEEDYILYKYHGKPMCVLRVAYSDGKGFCRYKLESTLNTNMDIFNWADINAAKYLYKLNNEELIAYMM